MSYQDIFSALGRYNSPRDENYLTEAFVFLINSLLNRDRAIGLEIITRLCVENSEFTFDMDEDISVLTQETTEQGRPDIKVSTHDKLIYIEVKHDSVLGPHQLERYKRALESSTASIKRVVLLTRFAVDFQDEDERPHRHIRWFQVNNWLTEALEQVEDPISKYLIEEFKSFLEAKQMTMKKVEWEYINGVPALSNLINMIEVAIQAASIPMYGKSCGWDNKGFYLANKEFLCGIYYSDHLVVIFETTGKRNFDTKLLKTPSYPMREDKDSIWFLLQLEDIHFFSLDKNKQLEEIIQFVKTAHAEFQQMRVR